MIHCQRHWSQLREALVFRGLASIVGQNYTPIEYLEFDVDGSIPEALTGDPMFDATRVVATLLVREGLYDILEGKHCPVCERLKDAGPDNQRPMEFLFSDYPANTVSADYLKAKLVPNIQ